MIVGVPKEVKDHETRVGLVPSGVISLREAGHRVLVETNAGAGSSLPDQNYRDAGAETLAALPYTRAVITEALRLYSPVWILPRRALAKSTNVGRTTAPGSFSKVEDKSRMALPPSRASFQLLRVDSWSEAKKVKSTLSN